MKKNYQLTMLLLLMACFFGYAQTARVQVIHNSADLAAETVDIYINDVILLDNFAFRSATPFINVEAGIPLSIDVAPGDSASAAETVYELTVTLDADETYILVADGNVSSTGYTETLNFSIEVYDLGRETANISENTDILVHHGATDAPTVDVNEVTGPSILVDDISYTEFSSYLELPEGNYTINVTDATGDVVVGEYLAPLSTLGLADLAITVVASGFLDPSMNSNGPSFGLWVALPTGGPLVELPVLGDARVQVIHNSADLAAETVDIYLNDALLLDDFSFRTATPFIDAPAGQEISIEVAPGTSTSSADAIFEITPTLTIGETYILVADGNISDSGYTQTENFSIEVYATGRETANMAGNTDVLVHHGATDAPTVDVNEVTGPTVLVDDISFPEFSSYLELPTADYTINVSTADGLTVVEEYIAPLDLLGLDDLAVTVLASGFLDPSMNSNGPSFGLWAALPTGGPLVELPTTPDDARVQVIHNSADLAAETVDVYLDDVLLLDDFSFRTASPFINAPAGVELSIEVAPGTSTSSADAIFEITPTLVAGETYILVADGNISDSGYTQTENFSIEVYATGRETANMAGNTDLLVHHGATDAPTVDVNEATGPSLLVDNISFPEFSSYLELPTFDYTINVTTADGLTVVDEYLAPLSTLGLNNLAITVVASGFLDPSMNSNGPDFGLWVALPTGGPLVELPSTTPETARVQVIHNSADLAAETVDVYLNDVLLIDDFTFRTASPFINAPAGVELSIEVAPGTSTSSADAIFEITPTLVADETYILVADGNISASGYTQTENFSIEVYATGREVASIPGNTDVLVHHGATDAPTVDVNEVTGPAVLVDNISFPEFSDYLELPTADYTINVSTADGTTVVEEYLAPLSTLGLDDLAITVVASGFLDPSMNSDGPAFGLWVALPTGGPLVELPATPDTARVQVIHNSADLAAQTVDVYLNDMLLIDDFSFRTASPFINAPAGVELSIEVAPGTSTSSADAIFEITPTLAADETYILVADGNISASGYTQTENFSIEVYATGREVASIPGNTDVLVHHGSTDAPTVDVNEVTGPAVLVDNISFPEFSDYLELPTADYTINVSTADGVTVVEEYLAPLSTLGLDDLAITVVASGFLDPSMNSDGPAFGLWVALPTGGPLVELPTTPDTARVQVIHNSADLAAQTVDVYLNDALLIDDFAFRTASPFIDAPAGVELSIEVAPGTSTSSADAIFEITPTLAADETYILVADGNISDSGYTQTENFSIEVYATAREVASIPGNTDVLVHHGATDAPTVDVNEVTGPAVLVDNISFPEFSDYLELPTADYTINVSTADGVTVVEEYLAPLSTLGLDDLAITVVASGFLDPSMNSDGPAFGLWAALPTGGPLVELPVSSLNVQEFSLNDITIYPNPAETILNISLKNVTKTEVKLYDIAGRLVDQTILVNANNTLDVSQLGNGMYILELSNENGKASTKITIK